MKKPIVIGIDGIHRSGKGTQKKMVNDYLIGQGKRVFTLRWEYYRTGNGDNKSYFNPYSSWWIENASNISNYKEKSERLEREIHYWLNKYLPSQLELDGYKEDWYVILDRTIFSRAISNLIYKQHGVIDSSSYFSKVAPDIIFILDVDQKETLRRLDNTDLKTEFLLDDEINYKRKFINSFFDQNICIKEFIEKNFTAQSDLFVWIDAANSPEQVSKDILTNLHNRWLTL